MKDLFEGVIAFAGAVSVCGGGDSGGGATHYAGEVTTSFFCSGCGERYASRCKCNGRYRPCPSCGQHVYWHNDKPEFHACGDTPAAPACPSPALMMAQGMAEIAQRIFDAGREYERDLSARGGSAQSSEAE